MAAELLFAQLLAPYSIGRKKKKLHWWKTVLSWSSEPVPLTDELKDAFNRGIAKSSPSCNTVRTTSASI